MLIPKFAPAQLQGTGGVSKAAADKTNMVQHTGMCSGYAGNLPQFWQKPRSGSARAVLGRMSEESAKALIVTAYSQDRRIESLNSLDSDLAICASQTSMEPGCQP